MKLEKKRMNIYEHCRMEHTIPRKDKNNVTPFTRGSRIIMHNTRRILVCREFEVELGISCENKHACNIIIHMYIRVCG